MNMSIRNEFAHLNKTIATKLYNKSIIEKTKGRHSSDAGTKYYL
jgi:hypothetical protein